MSFLHTALDLESEDGSTAVGEVLLVQRMIRVIRQAGMVDLFHLRVVGKVFHDLFGVLGMALHAQAQSLNTLQQQECVERADGSAGITQQDGTHIGYESSRAGSVHKADAVVAGVGCCNGGIVAGSSPVELAAVDDDAAQGGHGRR